MFTEEYIIVAYCKDFQRLKNIHGCCRLWILRGKKCALLLRQRSFEDRQKRRQDMKDKRSKKFVNKLNDVRRLIETEPIAKVRKFRLYALSRKPELKKICEANNQVQTPSARSRSGTYNGTQSQAETLVGPSTGRNAHQRETVFITATVERLARVEFRLQTFFMCLHFIRHIKSHRMTSSFAPVRISPLATGSIAAGGEQVGNLHLYCLLRKFNLNTFAIGSTVFGQLSVILNMEKVRAIDLWRLAVRTGKKILTHTVNCYISHMLGNPLLQFKIKLAHCVI